jgi:hypothetical protein
MHCRLVEIDTREEGTRGRWCSWMGRNVFLDILEGERERKIFIFVLE